MNNLAVLVSGNGTNLQAIIDACDVARARNVCASLPDTRVAVVVSNRREAYALERARQHGIPTVYHPLAPYRKPGRTREQYDADLAELLRPYQIDLVVQAGWMHILSLAFLKHYPGRVLNIHPALPGAFPGMHAIERAYEAFQKGEISHTGVMVHVVPDEGVDVGPVVIQQTVPIYPADTLDDLEARVHAVEHQIYVQAIRRVLGLSAAA